MDATNAARVRLCGELSIELGGERVEERLRGRQGKLLLAYLVLNGGRPIPRAELVEAIWPEAGPDHAALLSPLLSRLRAALPDGALRGRTELRLELPGETWIDVEVAFEALARAEAAVARAEWRTAWGPAHVALSIAERDLLPGFDAPWLDVRRRELEELRLDALECVAALGLRLGGSELAAAERAARRLIALAPLRESGHVALMEVQAARRNTPQALATYEELRRRLREELGTTPGADARAVHARLLSRPSPASRPAAPRAGEALPAPLRVPEPAAFVGRERDLRRLNLGLERAGELPRQLALVVGEPGIGKTRLLMHFGRLAHAAGAKVLYGRADEHLAVPYSPVLDTLREVDGQASAEGLRRAAALAGGELRRLLPELADRLPEPASPEAVDDPALARYRLFEALSALLADVAGDRPLVLLLDDLHWAEESSLQLLRHLLRAPRQGHLLLVAGCRDAELQRRSALMDVLADLQRDIRVERLHLRGLAALDVAALVRDSARRELPDSAIRAIHASTEGNPFFALELARHLAETGSAGAPLPQSVHDVILRRVAQLGDDAQLVLTLAAVLGREFELGMLERIVELPAEAIIQALEEAVEARVVEELSERPGRFAFAHALIPAVLYERLSAARRVRLHERVADLLETGTERARHLLAALPRGDAARAVAAGRHAAAEAAGMLAYEDAVEQLRRAAEALERHLPDDHAQRLAVLLDLADAQRRAGRMPEARETALEAVGLARRLGDAAALARAVLGYGGAGFESAFVDDTIVALLEEALAAHHAQDALRVELLSRLAKALHYSMEADAGARRTELSTEALELAERLGEPRAVLVALEGRHFALTRPENLEERLQAAEHILELAAETGDVERGLLGRYFLIADLVEAGDMEHADAAISDYGRRAEQARSPLHRWYHARFLAMRALLAGRFEEAGAHAQAAVEIGATVEPRTAAMHFGTQMWVLHRELGRLPDLEEAVRGFVREYPAVPAWRCGLAWVLLEQGRRDEARALLDEFHHGRFVNIPRDAIWSMTVTLAAELACAGLSDAEDLRALHALMAPYADRNAVTGEAIVSNGPMALYLGMTALALGDTEEAVAQLERARDSAARMGARPFEARAALLLARAVQGYDRDRAEAARASGDELRRAIGCAAPLA